MQGIIVCTVTCRLFHMPTYRIGDVRRPRLTRIYWPIIITCTMLRCLSHCSTHHQGDVWRYLGRPSVLASLQWIDYFRGSILSITTPFLNIPSGRWFTLGEIILSLCNYATVPFICSHIHLEYVALNSRIFYNIQLLVMQITLVHPTITDPLCYSATMPRPFIVISMVLAKIIVAIK